MEQSMHVLHSLAPKRRRNRSTKACWPCRDRKVRCDLQLPCGTCRKRNHVDLCRYGKRSDATGEAQPEASRPSKNNAKQQQRFVVYVSDLAPADSSRVSSLPTAQHQEESAALIDDDEGIVIDFLDNIAARLSETCETDALLAETVYLGRHSSANFFRFMHEKDTPDILPKKISLESAFALTNRTTLHPFGSLWSTVNVTLADVLKALPAAETCMRYYRVYLLVAQPIYHFLVDLAAFESRLLDFLQRIGQHGISDGSEPLVSESTFHDAAWYGLLFAVLGSGCQFSDTEPKDRILRTRVFVVCAFECLRHANLYVQPSAEVVQCMLLLESTIANDSNPSVGFSLLGLTMQQAQALGMHVKQSNNSPTRDTVHPLWRSIMALDSAFSAAFDRRPMSFLQDGDSDQSANSPDPPRTFTTLMHDLQQLRLDWQILSSKQPHKLQLAETIDHYFSAVEKIERSAQDTIGLPQQATSIPARVEQLFYQIHMFYFQAHIYRLASLSQDLPKSRRVMSFQAMKESLRRVIQAYMTLKQLSPIPNVAWDIQQATMSSALILAGIDRALETPESTKLLRGLSLILPHCSYAVPEEETEEMIKASYCHGLATLDHILNGTAQGAQTSPTSA